VLDQSGVPISLDATQLASLGTVQPGAAPVTVDLGGTLGQYRVIMQKTSASGVSLLIGLPLSEVQAIVLRLTLLIAVIGILGVAAAAIAGAVVVRLALRPLERVASTATRVAELPLDRGEVALAERVPGIAVADLSEAWRSILARAKMIRHHKITREQLSVRSHMSRILRTLSGGAFTEFSALFEPEHGVPVLVVSFLALLELARESLIEITQQTAFEPIYVRLKSERAALTIT